jgi:hypothetical protein
MTERPSIPADIKRRVLVEAGHRCAIPTCRHIEVDVHHIVLWETCKEHKYENLIALCPNCHRRVHKNEIDRKSLRIYKANLRYTHDRFSQFEVDVLFELYNLPQGQGLQWPPYLMLLIKRLLDSGYILRQDSGSGDVFIGGMKSNPDLLGITPKGREFVDSLGLDHDC